MAVVAGFALIVYQLLKRGADVVHIIRRIFFIRDGFSYKVLNSIKRVGLCRSTRHSEIRLARTLVATL